MKQIVLAFFTSLLLISCNPLGTDDEGGRSEFDVEISGALSTSIHGNASHAIFENLGGIIQLLSDSESPITINFTARDAQFPEEKTYTVVEFTANGLYGDLGEGQFHVLIEQEPFENFSTRFASELGTITITDQTDNIIEGTFDFEAVGHEYIENDNDVADTVDVSISVSGSFTSLRGELL